MRILIIATGIDDDILPFTALNKALREAKLDLRMGSQTRLK